MSIAESLIERKHSWLVSQVDVAFPTAESIAGRELYLSREANISYQQVEPNNKSKIDLETYLVDFHRLTVMFAQHQSTIWPDAKDRANALEFYAQITLVDAHQLYISFLNGEIVASALVTEQDNVLLVSDLLAQDEEIRQAFLHELYQKHSSIEDPASLYASVKL